METRIDACVLPDCALPEGYQRCLHIADLHPAYQACFCMRPESSRFATELQQALRYRVRNFVRRAISAEIVLAASSTHIIAFDKEGACVNVAAPSRLASSTKRARAARGDAQDLAAMARAAENERTSGEVRAAPNALRPSTLPRRAYRGRAL